MEKTLEGYDYLKHIEERTGKKLTLTGREKNYITSELNRREKRYQNLKSLLSEIIESDSVTSLEIMDSRIHHKTTNR